MKKKTWRIFIFLVANSVIIATLISCEQSKPEIRETSLSKITPTQWGPVKVSPDGKHIAYQINDVNNEEIKASIVVDGVASKWYDFIWDNSLVFSPNNHVIYNVIHKDRSFLVVDGVEGEPYDEVVFSSHAGLGFSFNGTRIGYTARRC